MKSGQTLRDLYEERSELYEKYADITVVVDNMSIEEIISNILKKYVKNG
jgi:shikimate kinase